MWWPAQRRPRCWASLPTSLRSGGVYAAKGARMRACSSGHTWMMHGCTGGAARTAGGRTRVCVGGGGTQEQPARQLSTAACALVRSPLCWRCPLLKTPAALHFSTLRSGATGCGAKPPCIIFFTRQEVTPETAFVLLCCISGQAHQALAWCEKVKQREFVPEMRGCGCLLANWHTAAAP
eukprot:COSAG01_NODE_3729_length_5755_cov_7.355135_6_plen_179_part_00